MVLNTRKIEAVIFDMDGVIADTMKQHYKANKRLATELGLDFNEKDNEEYKGISRMDVIKDLTAKTNKTFALRELEELSSRKNAYYKELLKALCPEDVLPGMLSFLEELKKAGIKMAVASSSTNVEMVLKKLEVRHYFDYVVNVNDVKNGKPDPEIFLKAANELGVEAVNCVAIEDGEAGLKAISKAKMFSVGIGEASYISNADFPVTSTEALTVEALMETLKHERQYVIGMDGGGTYIRTVLANGNGKIIASMKTVGGVNPEKNPDAEKNVKKAIKEIIKEAGIPMENVRVFVSGMAGIDSPEDLNRANGYTAIEGGCFTVVNLNDVYVAGIGALGGNPGIMVASGTGSMIYGFLEDGRVINNRKEKNHDARSGGVKLSMDALKDISGLSSDDLDEFVREMLVSLGVTTIGELNERILPFMENDTAMKERIGCLAPIITLHAQKGNKTAQMICERAMKNLAFGVELIAEEFMSSEINVATSGGVIENEYMFDIFSKELARSGQKYRLIKPLNSTLESATLLALKELKSY